MTWNKDYETLTAMRNTSTDKVKEIINRALEYAKSNVSPAAICGYLLWALG